MFYFYIELTPSVFITSLKFSSTSKCFLSHHYLKKFNKNFCVKEIQAINFKKVAAFSETEDL